MNAAAKGRRLEHDIRHLLEAHGWKVMRGAGSKGDVLDWKCDLIASQWTNTNKKQLWMVLLQCKVSTR